MANFYQRILPFTTCNLKAEYERWTYKWAKNISPHNLPSNPAAALEYCDQTFFPAIHQYLKIFCCIPATTATAERTFSSLRYLKTYLRSTTTNERLNGLTQLYLHRSDEIDINAVIDRFAAKSRRSKFVI